MTPEEKAVMDAVIRAVDEGVPMPAYVQYALERYWPTLDPDREWLPATFADCLAGDRIRLNGQETIVHATTGAQQWRAGNGGRSSWDHVELRMDLEANPGMRQYPPATACEILCSAQRRATLLLQQNFPGTVVASS